MEDGNVDQALKELCEAKIPLILENHRELGAMHSVYNKPMTNDFEINELMYGSQVELSALYQAYNSCYQLRKLRW
jgi:hypothetical protein